MTSRLKNEPHGKVHPETIPTVENTHTTSNRVEVVETAPVRGESFTTKTSNSHSHPTKHKESHGMNLALLVPLLLAIPLAGILGYVIHEPKVRVVTRTVTNTVPVLTVPASPTVTSDPNSPVPPTASPSPVGPAVVGPETVGPAVVGPAVVGPETVGPARVGPARVGPDRVGNE